MQRRLRVGILLHGNKIWLSELVSIFLVLTLIVALFSITFKILINELALRDFDRRIASLKVDKIVLTHTLEDLKEENRIASLLCSFVGRRVPPRTVSKLAEIVHSNSKQFGYDPVLLLSVMHVESRFDPDARGRFQSGEYSGALGLMQLKEETAREMAQSLKMNIIRREDLFKPEVNIVLATAYLTSLISRFKSFKLGLLAYNQGPGAVLGSLSRREPLSMRYYEKVLKSYYRLQQLANRTSAMQNQDCR